MNTPERMCQVLQKAARRRATATYGELMRKFGLSRGRKLTLTIGEVDRRESAAGAPGFAAIIVRKDTGFPGGGYFCDDELPQSLRRPRSRANDPKLSPEEIRHVRARQEQIWRYYGGSLRNNRVRRPPSA